MGRATFTPFVMNFSFRASAALDLGPGGTVTIFGPRRAFVGCVAILSSQAVLGGIGPEEGKGPWDYSLSIFPANNQTNLPRESVSNQLTRLAGSGPP